MIHMRDLIRQLGGQSKVASACGVTPSAVNNWALRGRVSSQHALAVWKLAREAGIEWSPPGAEGLVLASREAA